MFCLFVWDDKPQTNKKHMKCINFFGDLNINLQLSYVLLKHVS